MNPQHQETLEILRAMVFAFTRFVVNRNLKTARAMNLAHERAVAHLTRYGISVDPSEADPA